MPVDERQEDVGRHEEQQLPIDELVEGSLPLEEESSEASGSRTGHIALVTDGHVAICGGDQASEWTGPGGACSCRRR